MNEQALRKKRSYANTSMCCATEENHEKVIWALSGYKPWPLMLHYPAWFVLLWWAWLQFVNEQCKADYGVPAEVLVKIQ